VTSRIHDLAAAAYRRVLPVLYSRRGLPWRVHDEMVRIDPRVRHLVPHEPEADVYRFLRSTIRPGDVVLDVGAFLGIYAVLEARWTGSAGRVIAFEPTPASVAVTRRHLAWNGVSAPRVRLIEAAVSDRTSTATFYQYDAASMPYVNSLVAAVDTAAASVEQVVDVVTIDEVCRNLDVVPSVVRMDVQGAEVHALRGARETIRRTPHIALVVEMHPQCWPGFGVTEREARETIASLGLAARPLVASEPLFGRDTHAVLTRATTNEGTGAII
jgi:FkbM family methyltransferase